MQEVLENFKNLVPGDRSPLELKGVPEVPQRLVDELAPFLLSREAEVLDISPDGSALLVRTELGQSPQLHWVQRPLGARRQLTFGYEPVQDARWIGNPNEPFPVLFRQDPQGEGENQLYLQPIDGGTPLQVTDGRGSYTMPAIHVKSRHIAFTGNARRGSDFDLYVVDLSYLEGQTLPSHMDPSLQLQGHWRALDFSPEGTHVLLAQSRSLHQGALYLYDRASGTHEALDHPLAAQAAGAHFGSNAQEVFLVARAHSDHWGLHRLVLDEPEIQHTAIPTALDGDVEALAVSDHGKEVVFSINAGGVSHLMRLDRRTMVSRTVAQAPSNGVLKHLRLSSTGARLAATFSDAARSHDAHVLTLQPLRSTQKRWVPWTQSEYGGPQTPALPAVRSVAIPTHDQRELQAWLYPPLASHTRAPVLVYLHGGPAAQSRPVRTPLTEFLRRRRGVAVLAPNVRGSSGFGAEFEALDDQNKRPDAVRDVGQVLAWIAEQPGLDPNRVALYGAGYGGFLTLSTMAQLPDRVRCGLVVSAPLKISTYLEQTPWYQRSFARQEFGDERVTENTRFLQQLSPLASADRITAPLWMAYGQDLRTPMEEISRLEHVVRMNTEVWWIQAREVGAGTRNQELKDLYLQLTVLFLDTHLLAP